jgi:hypothetical protein
MIMQTATLKEATEKLGVSLSDMVRYHTLGNQATIEIDLKLPPSQAANHAPVKKNHDIEKAVKFLAQNNFEVEDGLDRIVWLKHGAGDEIRLIEVNRNGFPTGRVEAFYFAPSEEVPFETYLSDITPKEWQKVVSGEIPLPEGWSLQDSREFLRSEFEVDSVG